MRFRRHLGEISVKTLPLPEAMERYVNIGQPMPSWRRDLGSAFAQVPRVVYGAGIALSLFMAHRAYKRWKKEKGGARA
jgi:hypothetical protein